MNTKICQKCKIEQPIEAYRNQSKNRQCKKCDDIVRKLWRIANKDRIRQHKINEYQKLSVEERKLKVFRDKERRQLSPERTIRYLLREIRSYTENMVGRSNQKFPNRKPPKHTKSPIYQYALNYEEMVKIYYTQNGKCAISNLSMTPLADRLDSISIDRIDPKIGYLPNNVQFVCRGINLMKWKYSNATAIDFVNKIKHCNDK